MEYPVFFFVKCGNSGLMSKSLHLSEPQFLHHRKGIKMLPVSIKWDDICEMPNPGESAFQAPTTNTFPPLHSSLSLSESLL